MQQKQQKASKVVIIVSDPEVKKQYGGAKIYYLYSIKGQDNKGPIDIHRRYSDFDLLKNLLIKRWPGCYIPSLPSKVKLSNSNEQFLQTRSKYLRLFLLQLSKKQYIWNSDQVQLFLCNQISDYEKCIHSLWKIQLSELSYRYINQFKNLQTHEQQKLELKISEFSKYLNTLYIKIQQLRNHSQELNDSQTRYQKKFSKFLLNTLGTYQQKFLTYYNEGNSNFNPIFLSKQNLQMKNDLQESMKEIPLKILFQQIKRQKRQIFSIQQSIKQYEEYLKQKYKLQSKIKDHQLKIASIQNGKQSIFSKLKNVFTDDEIKGHERSIEKYKEELQNYNKILKIMKILLAQQQIQYFKKQRTRSYYKMVQAIARQELNILEKERNFWMSVCKNNHFGFQIDQEESKSHLRSKKNIPKQNKNKNQQQNPGQIQRKQQFKAPIQQNKKQNIKNEIKEQMHVGQKRQRGIDDQKDEQTKQSSQKQKNIKAQLRQLKIQGKDQSKQRELQDKTAMKSRQKLCKSQQKALKQLKNVNNETDDISKPSKMQKQKQAEINDKANTIENDEFEQIDHCQQIETNE